MLLPLKGATFAASASMSRQKSLNIAVVDAALKDKPSQHLCSSSIALNRSPRAKTAMYESLMANTPLYLAKRD